MEESRVLLGFDMETDIGSWTPWYRGFQPGTEKILAVLEKHDVKATFFLPRTPHGKMPECCGWLRNAVTRSELTRSFMRPSANRCLTSREWFPFFRKRWKTG